MQHDNTLASIPTVRSIFALAWPIALKAMMLHGIIVIDAYLVSSLGEEAVAAMGLAAAIGGLLLGVLFAFSNATQIRIAQAFGTASPLSLKTSFYSGLIINLAATLVGLVIVLAIRNPIITNFAHTEWVANEAHRYLDVFLVVIISEAVSQCLASFFNGCGNSKVPFYSYLIALPLNVVFSILLIHGLFGFPQLGVMGAAAGSAISSVVRVIYLSHGFFRITGGYFDISGWFNTTLWRSLKSHMSFSLPIATTFVSMALSNQACILLFAKMSVNDFAALTLITPWVMVAGSFSLSWAQSTGIIVAQLLGRRLPGHMLDIFLSRAWRSMFVAAAIVSVAYAGVCLASGWIYADLQAETKTALMSFLPILLILPHLRSTNAICGQTLRASGDTVYVMNIFVTAQWLCRVPLTALFILYLDLSVFWVFSIYMIEELVKFPTFHRRLYKGKWKDAAVMGSAD